MKTCYPKHFLHSQHFFLGRWFKKLSFAAVADDGEILKCELEFFVERNPRPRLRSYLAHRKIVPVTPNFLINFSSISSSCANEGLFKSIKLYVHDAFSKNLQTCFDDGLDKPMKNRKTYNSRRHHNEM